MRANNESAQTSASGANSLRHSPEHPRPRRQIPDLGPQAPGLSAFRARVNIWLSVSVSTFLKHQSCVTPFPVMPARDQWRRRQTRLVGFNTFEPGLSSVAAMPRYLAVFALLLLCQLVAAQFGFFEQMFQGEHPGRQQQQRQRPPGADHWRAQADAGESFVC